MAILPYMKQLPQDFYTKNYVPPPAAAAPTPTVYAIIPVSEPAGVIPTYPSSGGGVWYGDSPPTNPSFGWMWLNPANNGLYLYTDPGVWTQVGTNL